MTTKEERLKSLQIGKLFIMSYTLGDSSPFKWIFINNHIIVLRSFQEGPRFDIFTGQDIQKILDNFNQLEAFSLDNKVDDLNNPDKNGLGKFIFNNLNARYSANETTHSQASSHLASILVGCEVLKKDDNQSNKGMTFKVLTTNWKRKLSKYYREKLET